MGNLSLYPKGWRDERQARDYAEQRRHVLKTIEPAQPYAATERELFEPISATATALGTITASSLPEACGALQQLDWALQKLDALITEGTLLQEGLLQLRETLIADPPVLADKVSAPTGLDKSTRTVLQAIAQHRAVAGLTPQHLAILCQIEAPEVNEAIVTLRLEGLIDPMQLTDKGKERLGVALPPAIETEADLIKLWLQQLADLEAKLLRALYAANKPITLNEWAEATRYTPGSLSKGKPHQAKLKLIDLGLVSEGRISQNKLYSISRSLKQTPPAYADFSRQRS